MAIVFVIHEASRTGAPRLGALIARELGRHEPVRVIVMKDGPLTPWLKRTLGNVDLEICREDLSHSRLPFGERLQKARELLEGDPADIVYVNSLASSVFVFAASMTRRKSLVHVHEKIGEMRNLLGGDATKLETMRVADAALLAAEDIRDDLVEVFRALPPEVETFGIAVEVEAIRNAAAEAPPPPLNARGNPLKRGERLLVGMSGHASARKGADIFLDVAQALPECDFLWVGPWRPQDAADNVAYPAFTRRALANVYVTGPAENPFPYMGMMDLFFLSSREDPNPLVLAEAMALSLPILCFSQTTAVTDRLGRHAIVLHGEANVADAVRALRACTPEAVRRPAFRTVGEAFLDDYDLTAKMAKVRDLIARLRGEPASRDAVAVAPSEGAAKRSLGQGVVELTFS